MAERKKKASQQDNRNPLNKDTLTNVRYIELRKTMDM